MRHWSTVVVLLLVFRVARLPAQGTTHPIERVAWLTGCWERVTPRSTVEESWSQARGGTLIGTSRNIFRPPTGDSTTAWEFLRIFVRDGKLVYFAHPSGQQPAEFTQSELTDSSIVFANPTHDFPQRIIYRLRSADSLFARIEGAPGAPNRGIDFPFKRRSCP